MINALLFIGVFAAAALLAMLTILKDGRKAE